MKHLLGGGASIGGCNHASAELSERAIRSYFLPPFQAAIEAGGMTIMPGHMMLPVFLHMHQNGS